MEREPVNGSSIIKSVGYDEDEKVLEIEFHNGAVYEYKNVPYYEWASLISSVSVGTYFHNNIKNNYEYNRKE